MCRDRREDLLRFIWLDLNRKDEKMAEKIYTPIEWHDDGPPDLNAENLNHIEKGIDDLDRSLADRRKEIELLQTAIEELKTTLNDTITEKLESKIDVSRITNDLLATEPGFVLDARQGKTLADQIVEIGNQQNSDYAVTGSKTVLATAYNDKQVFTAPVAGVFEVLVSSFKDVYGCLHFTQSNGLTYKLLGSNNSGVGLSMHIPANAGDTITAQTSSASTNANAIEVSFIALK